MSVLWVEAKGHPNYLVSNTGHIVERVTRRPVPFLKTIQGDAVNLWTDNHRYFLMVHRLVAASFFDGDIEGMVVYFKDGHVYNNAFWNLVIVTREENRKYRSVGRARTQPIRLQNLDTGEFYESGKEAAKKLGRASGVVPPQGVRRVGGEFKAGGYRMKVV